MDAQLLPQCSGSAAGPSEQAVPATAAGQRVATNALLSELILSNMDIRSLHRVQRTSRQWNDVCRRVSKRRKDIGYFCYAYDFSADPRKGHVNVKPAVQLLHDQARLGYTKQMLDDYLVEQVKNQQWSKAKTAFLMQGGRRTCMAGMHSKFRQFLPPDCQVLAVTTQNGFIPSLLDRNTNTFNSIEVQGRAQLVSGVSYMLWPDLGFDVTFFNSNSTLSQFDPVNGTKKLKGIILFTNQCLSRIGRREVYDTYGHVNNMFTKYERGFALGGIVVDDISLFPVTGTRSHKAPKFAGIAFSGDNVKAASGVFDPENLEDLEQELYEFKQTLDFETDVMSRTNRTIGFLFTCSGRGPAMFSPPNSETAVVNKVFPGVLFTGLFGDGEFGENYWPKVHGTENVKLQEDRETGYWHFYTNVIVLVNIQL